MHCRFDLGQGAPAAVASYRACAPVALKATLIQVNVLVVR